MKNSPITLIFVLAASLLLLNQCKVGPNYQAIEVPVEDSYRFNTALADTDTVINLRWWELFRDPILDTLIRIALEENKDLGMAAAKVEEARARLGFTKADAWPQLSYQAGYAYNNFLQGIKFNEAQDNIFLGGGINWELDFWGKFRRANESERAKLLGTQYGYRAVQLGLISTVASSYFQLLDFKLRLNISTKTLALRESSLHIIEQRFEKGIVPKLDVNQAEIQRAIAAASVPQYERLVAETENALSVLLGLNPGSITTDAGLLEQPLPDSIPTGIPSILLTRRPDILQAEQNVVSQNALIGAAVAQRFPSISLTGFLGVANSEISQLFSGGTIWSANASLLGPLFYFNKNKRRVEIERAKTEQAIYTYEKTVLEAFQEVENALIAIQTLRVELNERQNQVDAAVSARSLSAQRYDKGVTSYLEVLETERSAFEAELIYSNTLQQLFSAYIDLYNALGGGWVSEAEEEMAQQAEAEAKE
jgi:multidrug efflux system outer membrane protein